MQGGQPAERQPPSLSSSTRGNTHETEDEEPAMSIELTEQQQQALDSLQEKPPQVIDPRTNAAYVLLPVEDYERVREILEEERRQKAIHAVALRNAVGRMNEAP